MGLYGLFGSIGRDRYLGGGHHRTGQIDTTGSWRLAWDSAFGGHLGLPTVAADQAPRLTQKAGRPAPYR